jgi:hypothetical protein
MKTAPPAEVANVVNASVTMFFQYVQPIKRRARLRAASAGRPRIGEDVMPERSRVAKLDETIPIRDGFGADGFDPPLDLVHLARHCLGDGALEAELLALFRLRARTLIAELAHPSLFSLESKAKIAHKIRGSALAVGAPRVAAAALRIEELAWGCGARPDGSAEARAIAALLAAIVEAVTEIDRIRG